MSALGRCTRVSVLGRCAHAFIGEVGNVVYSFEYDGQLGVWCTRVSVLDRLGCGCTIECFEWPI